MKPNLLMIVCAATSMLAPGQNWIDVNAPYNNWNCVVSSGDGVKLVASATNNVIYLSTNSGASWSLSAAPSKRWSSVATSADGNKLVAVAKNGPIYTSTNAGIFWTQSNVASNGWQAVASSQDGVHLVANGYNVGQGGNIYTSTNSGTNWNLVSWPTNGHPIMAGVAITSSGDGGQLTEVFSALGYYFYSTNYGNSWSLSSYGGPWSSVVSSADGSKRVGTFTTSGMGISTNLGTAWRSLGTPWSTSGANVPLAASSDCRKLAVAVQGGQIYTSANSGTNWLAHNVLHVQWSSIASSADGSKLVAVSLDGGIFTYKATPTMAIVRYGTNAVITWSTSGTGFELQQTSTLSPPNWVSVTNQPAIVNYQSEVIVPLSGSSSFYRLKSP